MYFTRTMRREKLTVQENEKVGSDLYLNGAKYGHD
jgi:hypothetical protein